jgi:protein-L-isoaspartate(D-aspartate) O-methyltransferase
MTEKPNQNRLFLWGLIIISLAVGAMLIFFGLQYRHSQASVQSTIPAPVSPEAPVQPDIPPAPADQAQTHAPILAIPRASQSPVDSAVTPVVLPTGAQVSNKPAVATQEPEVFKEFKPQTLYDIRQLQMPPRTDEKDFVEFMKKTRHEDPKFLSQRFQRCLSMIKNKDLWRDKEINAFLLTPREKFCIKLTLAHAYDKTFLDIGYGQTISGPFIVGRMTSTIDVQPDEKVLEIGTGSGYQSAILSHLTRYVYTIEIVEPLAIRANNKYKEMTESQYPELGNIARKCEDGYFGWSEYAPFDKIIVTCGIDHIPPELLKELKVGGIMVIPVGPPGAQVVLKITKNVDPAGNLVIAREDIYQGRKKAPFVPFTKKGGGAWRL